MAYGSVNVPGVSHMEMEAALGNKVNIDNGTVTGSAAVLDEMTIPGTYNWLDENGEMGSERELWNVIVSNSAYKGAHPSVTQTLFGTYGPGTKGRVLTRAFYYANNPQWTPWRELVSLDQAFCQNILNNWYFLNPVNQRGKAEYTTLGYTIDCWTTTVRAPTVQITENGVVVTAPAEGYADFRQRMENPFMAEDTRLSGNYTLSVLTADGLFSSTNHLSKDHRQIGPFPFGKGLAYFLKEGNYWQVLLRVNAGESITLLACKLERGSVQTLARKEGDAWVLNDPPPDPALELLKCQRYLRPLYIMYDHASSYVPTNTVSAIRQFNHEMRANPIILNPEDLGYNPFRFGGGTWSKERSKAPTIRHAAGPQGNVAIITYFLPENYSGDMHDVGLVSYKTAGTFSPLWLSAEL